MRARRTATLKVIAALALLVGLTPLITAVSAVAPPPAAATHFRANQITWHRTDATTTEFHLTGSWRMSAYFSSPPPIGATFREPCLSFGDSTSACPNLSVTAVDAANDVVSGEAHVVHQYAAVGRYTAQMSGCCRLSAPKHRNNPDDSVLLRSIVDLAGTSASPESQVSPIVDCGINASCAFRVPATDHDGQELRWRMAQPAEAGFGAQPSGAAIDSATGQYTWNTTGASLNTSGESFFSTQVIVENLVAGTVVASTPVDFFIRLTDTPNLAPMFESPTPADGTQLTTQVGQTVSFSVAASDPDVADTVTLVALGLPSDATLTTTPANPTTGTFSWTPSATGSVILTLLAQDQHGLGAVQRSVTITVNDLPPEPQLPPTFELPTPSDGAAYGPLAVGSALEIELAGSDPNVRDTVTLGLGSAPAGVAIESDDGNPAAGAVTWDVVEPPGLHSIVLTATDDHGNSAPPRTVTVNVTNSAPAFVAPTPDADSLFTTYRGTQLTVPLTVDDPDPDLRALTIAVVNGPAGAALDASSDPGVSSFLTWTPTALGSFSATVSVRDHWGALDQRTFQFTVINRPPVFTAPSPDDGAFVDVVATGAVNFVVAATDPDPETVRLGTFGIPSGATYTYVGLPGNPSQARFSWTPPVAGTHTVTFVASDQVDAQAAPRTVTLRVRKAPTAITAHPAIARVSTKPAEVRPDGVVIYDVYFPWMSAVLKSAPDSPVPNTALAGRVVKFYAGSTFICQGVTAADGQAFCGGSVATSQASVLMAQGYRAVFAGDATYEPLTQAGTLLQNTLA